MSLLWASTYCRRSSVLSLLIITNALPLPSDSCKASPSLTQGRARRLARARASLFRAQTVNTTSVGRPSSLLRLPKGIFQCLEHLIMPFPSLPSPPSIFPTYLVPSLTFRRRKSSTDSNTSSTSSSSTSNAVSSSEHDYFPQTFLTGHTSHLRCARCLSDLALSEQIVSKGFTGRHGRAYLVSPHTSAHAPFPASGGSARERNEALPNLPNTYTHRPVPRQLVTGAHTVSDISCAQCGSVLGWKYVAAEEEAQRYKVGKFILETKRVCRNSFWEEDKDDVPMSARDKRVATAPINEDEIEFDSQDEDECEDLFMGIWSPQTAARRRKTKKFARG